MNQPFVSCIMPTANRHKYIPFAIEYFLNQDYINSELVIVDDGENTIAPLIPDHPRIRYFRTNPFSTIGLKRNYACEQSDGEIIVHWDDDDWYANDWINLQVNTLVNSGADICGLNHVHFYSCVTDTIWVGTAKNRNNPGQSKQSLFGATLAYRKSIWEDHPFKDLQTGEDIDFVQNPEARVFAGDHIDNFMAILHPYNTTIQHFENPAHKIRRSVSTT